MLLAGPSLLALLEAQLRCLVTWPHGHRPRWNWPPKPDSRLSQSLLPIRHPSPIYPFGIKGLDSLPGVDCWTASPSLSFHIHGNEDRSNASKQPLQVGVEMNVNACGGWKAPVSKLAYGSSPRQDSDGLRHLPMIDPAKLQRWDSRNKRNCF